MRQSLATMLVLTGAVSFAAVPRALAVSGGNYDPAKQHCTGSADDTAAPQSTQLHCHSVTITIRDGNSTQYHEYYGFGIQQQPDTENDPLINLSPLPLSLGKKQTVDYWYDLTGNGADPHSCQLFSVSFDAGNPGPPTMSGPVDCDFVAGGSTAAPNPSSGLHLYFGADDNVDAGEHDAAPGVNNGPSDGGAAVLNLNPANLMTWMAYLMTANVPKLLVHPLPLLDGGLGLCADSICMSVQTTRRDPAYAPAQNSDGTPNPNGPAPTHQPVADYSGHTWDPYNCSNDDAQCLALPGHMTPLQWDVLNGDPAIEPGVQIFADPDAQASPIGPVYPIPAIYVGTCGVIIGGGALSTDGGAPSNQSLGFPPSPLTNSAGQIVIPTGCDTTADNFDN